MRYHRDYVLAIVREGFGEMPPISALKISNGRVVQALEYPQAAAGRPQQPGHRLGVTPKKVHRHAAEGRLLREIIHSGDRACAMCKQDRGHRPGPDLVTGAS